MAPSEKKTKNQYGYDKKSKTRYIHKDCIFSAKGANKTPSKSKNQVMDSDFCFFAKKLSIKHFILLTIYRLSIFYCILSWLLYGKHIWLRHKKISHSRQEVTEKMACLIGVEPTAFRLGVLKNSQNPIKIKRQP